ncbi:endonuclease/exonuclease/phosphatase family protein [Naumannella halotolerans]|uniref:Endonuclease/exonuclease/phosphatase (EEP) superfamily protein YafD n=1 Tax=Naumannella halotolerans TaxID=993414 RepID=A0A4R7JAD9_9ACTN|nr:endonuclease/exonuclease/phosphatase family protein [Naumannella halotolerans]TDT34335.1 endonuclease/exonuclease/phosphatase (EEP) superfamily protein YafD [Naumannella halotolerans]
MTAQQRRVSGIRRSLGLGLTLVGGAWYALRWLPSLDFGLPAWQTTSLAGLVAAATGITLLLPVRRRVSLGTFLVAVGVVAAASWVRLPVQPPQTPALRVAAINLQFSEADPAELREELAALDPDVLVLAEVDPAVVDDLVQALPRLELASPTPTGADSGTAVLLARTLTGSSTVRSTETSEPAGHQQPLVETPGLSVQAVHTQAPTTPDAWQSDLDRLDRVAAERRQPLIMVGDFNASADHPGFRQLAEGGTECRDTLLGSPTWPAPVPYVRIDHIVIFGGSCGAAGSFGVSGTDHRGIWADVTLD